MFAIIKTGGKQYKAKEGATLNIDSVPLDVGSRFEIKDVLLLHSNNETIVGSPKIAGAIVTLEVLEHFLSRKVIVFKKKLRTNYRRKIGHKQKQVKALVVSITNSSVN